jgi:Kef-type K+ transport system membrane component KefB
MHQDGLILFLLATALVVLPRVAGYLRIATSVLEILFGVVLGRSLLGLEVHGSWLDILARFGFLMLMFQAGMEIDFKALLNQRTKLVFFQVALFASTVCLAAVAVVMMDLHPFLALVLSTTSLGLVVPALKEARISTTRLGQTILIAATLADFLTLLGITFFVLVYQHGFCLELFTPVPLFAGFALLLWAARLWAWWHPDKAEIVLAPGDAREPGVRLSIALLFLFTALSQLAGLEPVLGAFMGGCIISFVFREKKELESKISAIGFGFLTPMFFIHVGMGFDVTNILSPERLAFAGMLLVVSLLVKIVPSLQFPLWGLRLGDGMRCGVLLSARLSLIVAAASIGLEQGFLTPEVKDAIVLLALLTCIIGPLGFKLLTPAAGE